MAAGAIVANNFTASTWPFGRFNNCYFFYNFLFKEFFNMSVKDTLKTWSVMETIVSVAGLLGVLCLSLFV